MAAQRRGFFQRIGDFFAGIFGRQSPSATGNSQQRTGKSASRIEPCLGQLPTGIPCTAQVELDDKRATACTMCGTPAFVNCHNCNQRIRGGQQRCSTCGTEQFGTCHACGKRLQVGIHSCERCHLADLQKSRQVAAESRSQAAQATPASGGQTRPQAQPTNIPNGVPLTKVEYEDI